jgi:transcriptional regulator with XRE-family HTH domain
VITGEAARFDGRLLHAALDGARRQRGVSWAQMAAAMGVSPSTLANTAKGGTMEADGVLCMCRWLGRPLADFTAPPAPELTAGVVAEPPPPGRLWRFDVPALHAALDAARRERGLSWPQMAGELSAVAPMSPGMLTRLRDGGRIGAREVVAIAGWLGRPPESFAHLTDR